MRLQRKRTKGYKTPDNCKYVGRPTKWGNPFKVDELGAEEAVKRYKECILNNAMVYSYFDEPEAIKIFHQFKYISENIEQLKGFDLSCFCNLENSCHVDVLIKLF